MVGMGQGEGQACKLSLLRYLPLTIQKKLQMRQAPRFAISKTMGEVPTMDLTYGIRKSLSQRYQ